MFHVSGTLQHLFAGFYWDANTYHTDICLPISYEGHLRLFVWKWLSIAAWSHDIEHVTRRHQMTFDDFRIARLNLSFASPVPSPLRFASRAIGHPQQSWTSARYKWSWHVLTLSHFQDLKWLPPALLVLGVQTFFHETYQGIWNASSSPIPTLSSPHVLETPVKSCKHIEVRSLPWTPLRTCHGCTSTFDIFQQA